jgi:aarF domain-containing kinase
MCEQLEHLQSSAPAHSFWYTKSVIERSLGMPIVELFDSFEEKALASGSIGQVHRATLGTRVAAHSSFPSGQKVVVKVKHAGVDDAIRRDFGVMMAIADIASRIPALEHLRLKDNLHQFAAPLREQVHPKLHPFTPIIMHHNPILLRHLPT